MRTAILAILLTACSHAPAEDSPLFGAARGGDAAAVTRLLRAGADPNLHGGVNDWPVLMHAVHKHQLGTAKALLDGGANPNAANPNGYTPLMMAAGYGDTGMVRLLVARGANVRLADRLGATALDYARDGVSDIDDFTLFRCQDDAARALLAADPAQPRGRSWWARVKRCA